MDEIEQLILIAFQNSSRTVHGVQNEQEKIYPQNFMRPEYEWEQNNTD